MVRSDYTIDLSGMMARKPCSSLEYERSSESKTHSISPGDFTERVRERERNEGGSIGKCTNEKAHH